MNPTDTGKTIAFHRKKAGFTQASLAEMLGLSDKAVSKWERGVACPDIAILPKLSVLLDTDIESLLNGEITFKKHDWKGILLLDNHSNDIVYSKPLVYFLLSNFLLVGIREILVIGGEAEKILEQGNQYGIKLIYDKSIVGTAIERNKKFFQESTMIVYGNTLIYGANLTRKYQNIISSSKGATILRSASGQNASVLFCTHEHWNEINKEIKFWKTADEMIASMKPSEVRFGRGVVCLPMRDTEEIFTAGGFVKAVESSGQETISDLNELARNRGLLH